MKTFERARTEHRYHAAAEFAVKPLDQRAAELPPLKLDHLHHQVVGSNPAWVALS
jgi:hypothetical protein